MFLLNDINVKDFVIRWLVSCEYENCVKLKGKLLNPGSRPTTSSCLHSNHIMAGGNGNTSTLPRGSGQLRENQQGGLTLQNELGTENESLLWLESRHGAWARKERMICLCLQHLPSVNTIKPHQASSTRASLLLIHSLTAKAPPSISQVSQEPEVCFCRRKSFQVKISINTMPASRTLQFIFGNKAKTTCMMLYFL